MFIVTRLKSEEILREQDLPIILLISKLILRRSALFSPNFRLIWLNSDKKLNLLDWNCYRVLRLDSTLKCSKRSRISYTKHTAKPYLTQCKNKRRMVKHNAWYIW